jgi:multidrug efflux pump subunit AcrA (membrane-fusion protein)
MDAVPVPGEVLAVPERVIVAPAVGVFRPLADTDIDLTEAGIASAGDTPAPPGTLVTAGQAIGVIEGPGSSTPVRSPFGGFLVGMLARRGERVREGQPVAWLRLA